MNTEHLPLYGIRYKDGDRKPFSILAEAEISTDVRERLMVSGE
jgi:hypothetical protein